MKDKPLKTRVAALALYWIVNSVVLLVFNAWRPDQLVLGNNIVSPLTAALQSGLLLAILIMLVEPLLLMLGIQVTSQSGWAVIYFVFNGEFIWLLGRMADFSGIGLGSFFVAVILGMIVTIFQWAVWIGVKDRIK